MTVYDSFFLFFNPKDIFPGSMKRSVFEDAFVFMSAQIQNFTRREIIPINKWEINLRNADRYVRNVTGLIWLFRSLVRGDAFQIPSKTLAWASLQNH